MLKHKIETLVESSIFQNTILVLIVVNTISHGLETSGQIMQSFGFWLKLLDSLILKIFVIEILLKLYVYRLAFFKNAWNLFDTAVIVVALVPASEAFGTLRALRVIRVLRVISAVPSMRQVIEGLLAAIPGIASVATLMMLVFYVFSVIGTHLYAATFPNWFGTLGETMYTLFQIMTLESWSMGIVRPVMEVHPNAWVFFLIYILTTTFTMLNLFIAIIVSAMDKNTHQDHESENAKKEDQNRELLNELRLDIQKLEERLVAEIARK